MYGFWGVYMSLREDLQGSSLSQVTSRKFLSKLLFDKQLKLVLNGSYRWLKRWPKISTEYKES